VAKHCRPIPASIYALLLSSTQRRRHVEPTASPPHLVPPRSLVKGFETPNLAQNPTHFTRSTGCTTEYGKHVSCTTNVLPKDPSKLTSLWKDCHSKYHSKKTNNSHNYLPISAHNLPKPSSRPLFIHSLAQRAVTARLACPLI
jgi:hypothetical protein